MRFLKAYFVGGGRPTRKYLLESNHHRLDYYTINLTNEQKRAKFTSENAGFCTVYCF